MVTYYRLKKMKTKWLLFLLLVVQGIAWGQTAGQEAGVDCRLLVDGQLLEQTVLSPTGDTVIWDADMQALPIGLHHVIAQVLHQDADGIATTVQFESFFFRAVTPEEVAAHHIVATCYIDDELFKQETLDATGGVTDWNLDMTSVPVGLHQIKIFAVDHYGSLTHTDFYQSFFYRIPANEDEATHHVEATCYIDGQLFKQETFDVLGSITDWNLDMSSLPEGLHQISVVVMDHYGTMTRSDRYDSFFYRVPMPTDDIGFIGYDVWANDEHQGHADVSPRQIVYMLDTTLTVTEQEFRSMSFHFAVEDGVPVVYAQNDLWVMFHDASGKAANAYGSYTDIRTRSEVTDLTLLRPGETVSMQRPGKNLIKWFIVEALTGDSVMFKTDKACTWQLFSPSGEELYRASDAQATEWGGTLAPEDGTYYVAVHDMSVSGNELSISYKHVDGQFAIDEADWAILQAFYAQYGNGCFTWDLSDNNNVRGLEGVSVALRHVVEIRLPDCGLEGAFPTVLLELDELRLLDLSQNALSGEAAEDIAHYCAQHDSLSSRVQELYLSYNDFSGNVGALASQFAELTVLDVANNHFNEVSPAVPSRVTLSIDYQRIAPVNGDISHGMDAFVASIPAICYYNHRHGDQFTTIQAQLADTVQNPYWNMNLDISDGSCTQFLSDPSNNVYRGANGQDIIVYTFMTSGTVWNNKQLLNAVFSFAMGDANLNGEVDIDDLRTIINRIFTPSSNMAFNFTASNHYPDNILNVQDVVGQVNLLLSANPVEPNGNLMRMPVQDEQLPTASLYWSDGVLYLNSQVPVAAIDIINAAQGSIHWNLDALGMIVSKVSTAQGEHAVIYSLGDALIPAGVTPLATTAMPVQGVVWAKMTDEDAQGIPVRLNDAVVTGIQEVNQDMVNCRYESGKLVIDSGEQLRDVDVLICTVDGRVIHQAQFSRMECGETAIDVRDIIDANRYCIVVVRSAGQVIATQKLTQIR